jgi:hypothetical protein
MVSSPACAEIIAPPIQTMTIADSSTITATFHQPETQVNLAVKKDDRSIAQTEPLPQTTISTPPQDNNSRIPLSSRIFAAPSMQQ